MHARPAASGGRWVEISPHRLRGWLDGFYGRHDGAAEAGLVLTGASNGDTATLHPPPGIAAAGVEELLVALGRPPRIAVLLVRRGAVAVGVADARALIRSKVERFYVQGRTAAGGWSQQRFARRRDNQADAAAREAADIAARVLLPYAPHAGKGTGTGEPGGGDEPIRGSDPVAGGDPAGAGEPAASLVCGGDRLMVDAVLADRRLAPLAALRHPYLLEVAEPRLAVLEEAVVRARRVRIHLVP